MQNFFYWVYYKILNSSEAFKVSKVVQISMSYILTIKAPNKTIAEFANTVDPEETAHNKLSHQDLQCVPSSLQIFNIIHFELKILQT